MITGKRNVSDGKTMLEACKVSVVLVLIMIVIAFPSLSSSSSSITTTTASFLRSPLDASLAGQRTSESSRLLQQLSTETDAPNDVNLKINSLNSTTTTAVRTAYETLQEAGIVLEQACHPSSSDFGPLIPVCEAKDLSSGEVPPYLATTDNLDGDNDETSKTKEFYIQNAVLALICVCTAALAAGLTMGLMSLDPLMLHIKLRAGSSEEEKQQAAKLLPIVKQHHRLLVTLLLLNSMANEALPLFLDALVPSYVAVILSVTLVLFFGEIIPSAVFTGPDQMKIAASLTPLVQFFFVTLCPLAYPIAKMLDCLLHDENESGSQFNRGELTALVRIQYEERLAMKQREKKERAKIHQRLASGHYTSNVGATTAAAPTGMGGVELPPPKDYEMKRAVGAYKRGIYDGGGSFVVSGTSPATQKRILKDIDMVSLSVRSRPSNSSHDRDSIRINRSPSIHFDEVNMVEGALAMGTKRAIDVYTPLRKVFAIADDTLLDEVNVVKIYSSGYSRVPVFHRKPNKPKDVTAVIGILMTKQLIVVNPNDGRGVDTLPLHTPFCVSPTTNLIDLINMFQTGGRGSVGGHLALVCVRPLLAGAALSRNEPVPEVAGVMGIITLEDVLEEILQEEIFDETDKLERNQQRVARWAFRKWKLFVHKRKIRREEELLRTELATPALLHVVEQTMGQSTNQGQTTEESPLLQSNDENTNNGSWLGLFG